jgi:hypothetical protein
MRFVFGGFLIVSGLALAIMEVAGTHINASHADDTQPTTPPPSTSTVQLNAPVTTGVILPVRSRSPEELVANIEPNARIAGADLVSALQRELARVQCYDGPVNGHWSVQTRKAMAAFLHRANAKLPTDQADLILLALIKNHSGVACGSCPTGQEISSDGRCVPHAIIARALTIQPLANPTVAGGSPRVSDAGVHETSRRARRRAPIEGRMSVGGPLAAAKPANRTSKITAEPVPSDPPAAQQRRERRAARHAGRRLAGHSRGYLRAMRAPRYAYRPRGIASLLFGWF